MIPFDFRRIETNVARSKYSYESYDVIRITRKVIIRRWPRFITELLWSLKNQPGYGHKLMSPNINMDINFETEELLVDGEIMTDWIKSNCKGDVKYYEDYSYSQPFANPSCFEDALVDILFLNLKDAMLFKLRFG